MTRTGYLPRKSVQHFDSLSGTGPLSLPDFALAFHFAANPFRWKHNRDAVRYVSVETRVLSFTVAPNGKEGERHE
jgi:hypothetical protein